jgi:uroporphyrinogen-III synthase
MPVPVDSDNNRLSGWRVLVPRPVEQAGALSDLLVAAGADPVSVPLIEILPPLDLGSLDLQLIDLAGSEFTWVGFTSVNAVRAVVHRAVELGLSPAVPANTFVAAVGPTTATTLREAGLPVDLIPPGRGSAAALADLWPGARVGESVFLPRSDIAPDGLPQALAAKGFRVETCVAYRTAVRPPPPDVAAGLGAGDFDAVLFTSPSTVTALRDVDIAASTVLGAIGEPTARAADAAGRPVHFVAAGPSAGALVEGLAIVAGARLGNGLLGGGDHQVATVDRPVAPIDRPVAPIDGPVAPIDGPPFTESRRD